jgi:MFS family permease
MFGSLAWGGGAFIAGYLIDTYGMNALFYYTYLFNFTSLIFVIFILPNSNTNTNTNTNSNTNSNLNATNTATSHTHKSNIRNQISNDEHNIPEKFTDLRCRSMSSDSLLELLPKEHSQNENSRHYSMHKTCRNFRQYLGGLFSYLSNAPCRAILFNSFLYGVVMTVPDTFLFVSLDVDFKASRTFSGMMTSTSIVACLPLFWYSTSLISSYGHYNLIFLAESSCIVRLLAYSLLSPNRSLSLYILPIIQLIHGLNFALYWSASVDAVYTLAPVELTTICIAALNVSYYTFGGAIGNIVFGFIYDYYGGARGVYLCAAVLLVLTLSLFKSQQNIINAAFAVSHSHTHTQLTQPHTHTHQPCDREL